MDIAIAEYLDLPAPSTYGASEFGHVMRASSILSSIRLAQLSQSEFLVPGLDQHV